MSKKAIIELELKADGYKADVAEIQKANNTISESATKAANQATEAYTQTGKAAKNAFASTELKNALVTTNKSFNVLTASLVKINPTLKLTSQGLDQIDKSVKTLNVDIPKTAKDVAVLEDQLRELALEGKQNTEQFTLIAKAIGSFKSAITTADRAVDLYAKSTDAATGRIGELEDKLYDLALAGKTNSKEFRDLVGEVANVKRAIVETDAQVDSFVERSRGFGTVVQNIELVGSAFQVVEGAAALFGEENEELQKTLVKLQAITAITSGLEQARLALIEQSAKKTGIAAVAQRGYNLAVGTSTGVLKGFRLALAATGVGLLVIGLVAIIQNFEKIKNVISNAIPGFGEVAKGIGQVIDKTKEFLGIDDGGAKAKLALDNLIGFEKTKTDFQVAEIDRRINILKAENKNTSDLEAEKQKIIIQSLKKQVKSVRDNQAQLVKLDADTRKEIRDNTLAAEAEILDIENEVEVKRIDNATKAVQDRLNIELNGLKLSELINGESLANQEAQLRKKAEIDKNNAKQTIQNAKLRASSIKLIEAQLGLDIAKINLDAQNKIIENEVKLIEAKKVTGTATIEEEIKQANLSFSIEKSNLEAKIKLNQASDADLKLLTANNENKIKQIRNRGIEENFNLRVQALELNKLLGATSLEDEIKLIKARAEAELKANENSTKSIQQKEADRKAIIVKTDAEITQAKVLEANKRIDIDNAESEAAVTLGKSTLKQRIDLIEDEGQKSINLLDKKLLGEEAYNAEVLKINAKTEAGIRDERKKTTDESIRQITEYVDAFTGLLTNLNDLSRQQTENRINDLTAQQQKEIQNINDTFQTETQKQRQREAAEFRFQRQIALEKQKQAIQDKKLALLSATVNTAKAIVAALPNIPLSILVGIAGAAQIAAIASQPIPKFEKGGEVRGKRHRDGGTLIEAEEGEYIINRNQTRRHGEEISALNRSTAEFHRLLERKYIQPRIASILSGTNRRSDKVVVNATLNARTMEGELKGLRKDIRRSASKGYKSNQTDTRYQWQRN